MMPMNNPLIAMIMALLQQMAGRNPQAAQVLNMMQGKSPQQLRAMAENMARERGTTLEEVARQLGMMIPQQLNISPSLFRFQRS